MIRCHGFTWKWLVALLLTSPSVGYPESAHSDLSDPKQQLKQILQKPIYQRWQLRVERQSSEIESTQDSLLATYLKQWSRSITDAIKKLFDWIPKPSESPSIPSWGPGASATMSAIKMIVWVLLVVAIGFIVVVVYRMLAQRQVGQQTSRVLTSEQIQDALEEGEALAMGANQWLDQAQRLKHEGDGRAVYRALYLGLLSGLHANGKIDFRRTRTNWTYVDRFHGTDEQQNMFVGLTSMFDDVWYGLQSAGSQDFSLIRAQIAQLIQVDSD